MSDPISHLPEAARVLVVDRNATVRRAVARALERVGLPSLEAPALDGVDLLADSTAALQLLIVDCSRPDDAHWMALSRWQEDGRADILPITVHPTRIPVSFAQGSHVLPTLPKPFSPFRLVEVVRMALDLEQDNPFVPRLTPRTTEELIDVEVDIMVDGDDSAEVGELPEVLQLLNESTMQDLDDLMGDVGGTSEHFTPDGFDDWDERHGSLHDVPVLDFDTLQPTPAVDGTIVGSLHDLEPLDLHGDHEEAIDEADILWEDEEIPSVYEPPRSTSTPAQHPSVVLPVLTEAPEPPAEDRAEVPPAESSRPRRAVADWAVQLAQDWEHIGLETDLTRRAELIQTAVIDIEPEPDAHLPARISGQIPALPLARSNELALQPLTFSGDLVLLSPLALLRIVREGHLSGALELSCEAVSFRLTVWGDTLRYLEPRTPHEDLLLGRILLAQGHLEPEALQIALSQDDDLPLGARLLDVGIIGEEELSAALRLQARAYFYEICRMHRGQFIFREMKGGSLPRFGVSEPRPLNFRVSELLLEVVRDDESNDPRAPRPSHERDETRLVKQPSAAIPMAARPVSRPNLRLISTPPELRAPATEDTEEVEDLVERLRSLGLLDPPDDNPELDPEDA